MAAQTEPLHEQATSRRGRGRIVGRFARSEDGVAAIEFALLAIPFFMLVFAIIESCVAFAAEQVLDNAVDTMSRQVRTGQITFEMGRDTDMTAADFREAFCERVSLMLSCDDDKLFLDVRAVPNYGSFPVAIPREGNRPHGDLDDNGFDFDPGGPGSINMMRGYYKWPIITDLVRPYITNIRPEDGSMPTKTLIVGTAAFVNEGF